MKERVKQLIQNKYVMVVSIATVAVIFIIILLLVSKGCNGSKESDKKEVNADVTTTKKEKKTTKKEERETTQSEETTSLEETTLPEETSEEVAQTQHQEANNSTSDKSPANHLVTQPVTQPPAPSTPENTQPPAPENTQPTTVVQPATEGRKRTRNTSLENKIWQYWQREFRVNVDAKLGNKDNGESRFSGELVEIAKKFCQRQYSSIEVINRLSEKQITLTDYTDIYGNPVSAVMKVHRDGTNAIVKDVTGKTPEQMSRQIFEEIAEYFRVNHVKIRTLGDTYVDCFDFMDADYVEACAVSPEFFIYFQLYDETDGTTKMYLVYSYVPYYF